ncbi:MAG: precorrin-3B C(17)-methyltransferase [Oscillospiraceae bacterium]|nr:precorrin-3B C(17)-methyltransferase [Oscillospiraceae bacterium]
MDKIIYVVGFGPGDKQFMTMQAVEIIEQADLIVGYTTYTDILKAQFPDKKYLSTPMRKETDRCRLAVEKALEGNTVAMVSSGDSGIYGMAGIMLEIADEMQANVEIVTVPGITAASTAASVLGAPLMHDLSLISLSDLMTPLELIFRRVEAAASADFVISLYNPKSRKRVDYLEKAADIIMKYRDKGTPVGIVRNAGRPDQKAWLTTLSELKNEPVDMFCVVIVGNSQTYIKNNRMITPRGYKINEQ